MEMVTPRIEILEDGATYGKFVAEPLEQGFGYTVGNALRRVLLSSIPGAAITSVRVTGVPHEFSEIPGAKEDMLMLTLNLKKVRLLSHSEEPVHMRVSAKGKSVITAGDIECPADVEIVNPELQLLTLDTLDSELELELVAERGVGYSTADERPKLPIGEIPVDAIYCPVTKVNYTVEATRIEQFTDYDMLKLEIWTDGTTRPGEALAQAAAMLVQHFTPLAQSAAIEGELLAVEDQGAVRDELYNVPIEELELAMRPFNCLKRAGISSVGEIREKLEREPAEMLAIRNFGQKSLTELVEKMIAKGYLPADYELKL